MVHFGYIIIIYLTNNLGILVHYFEFVFTISIFKHVEFFLVYQKILNVSINP